MSTYDLKVTVDRGMGTTYGNFIRRVAMIRDTGWALAGIRINGGACQTVFEIPEGVGEDVCEMVSNLQQVKVVETEPTTDNFRYIAINISGEDLTVAHLENQLRGFSLSSSKQVLAHLQKSANLGLELIYLKSCGSRNKQENEITIKGLSIDNSLQTFRADKFIFLNTLHKSIDKVFFTVTENADGTESLQVSLASEVKNIKEVLLASLEQETKQVINLISKFD